VRSPPQSLLAMTEEGEEKIHRAFPVLLFGFLVEPFRNDPLLPSCLSALIRHPHHSSFPKFFIGNPKAFTEGGFFSLTGLLCFLFFVFPGVMRGQRPLIVLLRHSRNLQSGIHIFKYCGPRLKDCRGDEQGAINTFRGRLKTARKSSG